MATDTWVIRNPKGAWIASGLKGARTRYRYPYSREVLQALAVSEYRGRYRAQALGAVWSIVSPLAMMGLLTIVGRGVFRMQVPHFPTFLVIGVVSWNFLSRAWSSSTNVFISQGEVAKRAVFPRYLMPTAMVLSYLANLGTELAVALIVVGSWGGGVHFGLAWLALPLVLVAFLALVIGLAMATSSLNARFRDVSFMVDTLLVFLYWLTPIVYSPDSLPDEMQSLIALNPMSGVLSALRTIIMEDRLRRRSRRRSAGRCARSPWPPAG